MLAGVIEPASATPVRIDDDVMIGANAVVLEGVHVGEHAVVAAGAVVVEDVPPMPWSQVFQRASTAYLAGSAVPQEQLSETHYLMMGMNGETYGGHSPDDVAFSQSFESLADRQRANLQRAWERVCEKGLWGNVRFFTIKLYKAYATAASPPIPAFWTWRFPAARMR